MSSPFSGLVTGLYPEPLVMVIFSGKKGGVKVRKFRMAGCFFQLNGDPGHLTVSDTKTGGAAVFTKIALSGSLERKNILEGVGWG